MPALTENTIVQYIHRNGSIAKKKDGKKISGKSGRLKGLLLAKREKDGTYTIGWSMCHRNDRFNKETALNIAWNRADKKTDLAMFKLPHAVQHNFQEFVDRCEKYFKGLHLNGEQIHIS